MCARATHRRPSSVSLRPVVADAPAARSRRRDAGDCCARFLVIVALGRNRDGDHTQTTKCDQILARCFVLLGRSNKTCRKKGKLFFFVRLVRSAPRAQGLKTKVNSFLFAKFLFPLFWCSSKHNRRDQRSNRKRHNIGGRLFRFFLRLVFIFFIRLVFKNNNNKKN